MKEHEKVSIATRFTDSVIAAYSDVAKGIAVNERERALIANYYVEIDTALQNGRTNISWKDIDMKKLSLSIAHTARMNLDMKLSHLSFIPFRDGKTGKYNMVPVISSRGWEYIVKTFSLEPVKNVIVELVYSTDKFSIVKRDSTHPCDSYSFEVGNPFDRGSIIGGFAYCEFENTELNKLLVMSLQQIMTFKPSRADDSFWGVKSPNYTKMLEKTLAKQLLKKIPLDPDKINGIRESLKFMEAEDLRGASLSAQEEIREKNGQGPYIDFGTVQDADYEEVSEFVEKSVEVVEDENEVVSKEDDILGMNQESLL